DCARGKEIAKLNGGAQANGPCSRKQSTGRLCQEVMEIIRDCPVARAAAAVVQQVVADDGEVDDAAGHGDAGDVLVGLDALAVLELRVAVPLRQPQPAAAVP